MRKSLRVPRLVAALLVLGACGIASAPAGIAVTRQAQPVPTVFIGDSYTANFGVAPLNRARLFCFQSQQSYPAVATERLAERGIPLQVQADVSCGGAVIHHVWEPQPLLIGQAKPQRDALKEDTELVVGSMGGNTAGFAEIMKQCSERLRGPEGNLLPAEPVNAEWPAAECQDFFENGEGANWLKERFDTVRADLDRMFDEIRTRAPLSETVLVGYPRIVPEDTAKCLENIPGGDDTPLADIGQEALRFLDKQIQEPLDNLMRESAEANNAHFAGLYRHTGGNTACDGEDRGIGAMLETSEIGLVPGSKLPWFVHPNRVGRDVQAAVVTDTIEQTLRP
ncbi:SGNH/GDSL hydrolase family protein [Streptomyces odonnellii]|uniref:SGNH/GDSL hydrolase family protein n=1 Tax=Streptomyces odonnellii TaxID=1417980 RepID=UPI000A50041C|nr:SGNH/GDSL hydrolase family protein [Streptomyces odonnellii]